MAKSSTPPLRDDLSTLVDELAALLPSAGSDAAFKAKAPNLLALAQGCKRSGRELLVDLSVALETAQGARVVARERRISTNFPMKSLQTRS